MLLKRLPILDWLPRYSLEMLGGDLIAGISVGLTVIPQSIAYGLLAELPPEVMVTFFLTNNTKHGILYFFANSCAEEEIHA